LKKGKKKQKGIEESSRLVMSKEIQRRVTFQVQIRIMMIQEKSFEN
jgi:hypothetical protein